MIKICNKCAVELFFKDKTKKDIIPISSPKTEEDIIALNHYTNLQPLCSKINRHIKKGKI